VQVSVQIDECVSTSPCLTARGFVGLRLQLLHTDTPAPVADCPTCPPHRFPGGWRASRCHNSFILVYLHQRKTCTPPRHPPYPRWRATPSSDRRADAAPLSALLTNDPLFTTLTLEVKCVSVFRFTAATLHFATVAVRGARSELNLSPGRAKVDLAADRSPSSWFARRRVRGTFFYFFLFAAGERCRSTMRGAPGARCGHERSQPSNRPATRMNIVLVANVCFCKKTTDINIRTIRGAGPYSLAHSPFR
jgi:hypothetical protein